MAVIISTASSRAFSLSKSRIKSHLGNTFCRSFSRSSPVSSPLPVMMIPVPLLDSTIRCVRGRRTWSYTRKATSASAGVFERPSRVESMRVSSNDMPQPEPCHGVVAWAASPMMQIGPDTYVRAGRWSQRYIAGCSGWLQSS